MDSQLPLFKLVLVGLAVPLSEGGLPLRIYEVWTWDGTLLGYAFEEVPNAA